MFKLSELIAKLENRFEEKFRKFLNRYKGKFVVYIPLIMIVWYFYGMFLNSIDLGIKQTFGSAGEKIESVWVANPFRNILAIFTPTGMATTGICVLLICLIMKKGYFWFSGYKYTRDARGFDILPDSTHGSSGFMNKKEMKAIVTLDSIENIEGTVIGKLKDRPDDDDKYSKYLAIKKGSGLSDHTIVFGSTGSGKSRGYVTPFMLQAIRRRESLIIVDPKGELYEKTSEYMRSEEGYTTKIFNLLDPENSDGWNSLNDIEFDPMLVDSIAETIIKNTSNVSERQDFWEKAEKNLLQALMHYVQSQKVPGTERLLPIEQRSLGAIYRMLADESFADLERRFDELPKGHRARAPYGIFKLANRQIWGNIAIGLGNRLSVFQNEEMDKITSYNDIDLTLPGKKPCAYYCAISAQDSKYEFLSSLFFSCLFSRLTDYARREGVQGRLPVTVNFLLEEFCNIGKLVDFKRQIAILRGFNINSAPFITSEDNCSQDIESESRPASIAYLEDANESQNSASQAEAEAGCTKTAYQEVRKLHVKTCEKSTSRDAELAHPDMQFQHTNNINKRDIDNIKIDSQSVCNAHPRDKPFFYRHTERDISDLEKIIDKCELWAFPEETAKVFASAIERLYFTENYRIGNAVLPQGKVRAHLWDLNSVKLQDAEHKIQRNTDRKIRNTTAYVMAVIFNSIRETESDLMCDPYLNSLQSMSDVVGGG